MSASHVPAVRRAGLALAALACAGWASAQDVAAPAAGPVLKPGARVAIVGDSITEQKLYSRFLEVYLRACVAERPAAVLQLGWGGETAQGFVGRMERDLLPFKPTLVTTCYGMNDGGYRAYAEPIGESYRNAMQKLVEKAKAAGAVVVAGSPGAVDTLHFRRGTPDIANVYNESLGKLGDLARGVATAAGMPFADVHAPLIEAMAKAKAALGEEYDVCGRDGVHPGPNGHLVMAAAFLKALGVAGDIGTIRVTLGGKDTAAVATPGHKVIRAEGGTIEIESERYPYCFVGDTRSANSPVSILPFFPFQQELNRLVLEVKGLQAEKAKVTWGAASRDFTRAELEAGVNLAEAFLDNPFCAAFAKVDQAVAAKQNYETAMVKGALVGLDGARRALAANAETDAAIATLTRQLWARQAELDAAVRETVVPVRHTLVIE
ncbi:MAG: GDSL-like Lipase/Acylhydrolase [Lentisphaerae bacterium ADurb.BinA184]|nr:MAG: GDSL-like Lipase/Acylhydrolase [Lentisphaerae bacterium ADurb.BinA184]